MGKEKSETRKDEAMDERKKNKIISREELP